MKQGCPRWQQGQNLAKPVSPTFSPRPPQGHVMSVKCEEHFDELIVQSWLLCDHQNFKYCTLHASRTELRVSRTELREKINRQRDSPIARWPPADLTGGAIKTKYRYMFHALKEFNVLLHTE